MDSYDLLRFVGPAAAFALAVLALIYCLPWPPKTLLTREQKRVKILDVVQISHDTKRLRISLGDKGTVLGLPVGKHLVVTAPNPSSCITSGEWNGCPDLDKGAKDIDRPYTPIAEDETGGYFDLVVKVYRPGKVGMPDGTNVTWHDGGKVSLYLDSKRPGDEIEINGPLGVHQYLGRGTFMLPGRTVTVKHVAMLAGGTGITPMMRILSAALRDSGDHCRFTLIYANKTEDDILLRDRLESLVDQGKGQLNVVYTLDSPPQKWKHEKGFITAAMIRKHVPAPRSRSLDPLILMCGPTAMVENACRKNLEALGYPKASMVSF